MIAQLVGRIVDDASVVTSGEPGRGVIDVNGVGYEIHATSRSLHHWAGEDQARVHVSTQVREDAITLFAFESLLERDAFLVLLGVNGVGPKMALQALEALSVEDLHRAVESDDVVTLCRISGVGKKKAQRLALELKGKLPVSFDVPAGQVRPRVVRPADDLPLALAQLDYGKTEIDRALAGLEAQGIMPDAPLQQRLKAALQVLAGGKR